MERTGDLLLLAGDRIAADVDPHASEERLGGRSPRYRPPHRRQQHDVEVARGSNIGGTTSLAAIVDIR